MAQGTIGAVNLQNYFEPMAGFEPATSSLPRKCSTPELHWQINQNRAEDGAQTRDPQLGRLMLYRLSYFRRKCGRRWIRTTEGISQQIYSLPHLATLVFALQPVKVTFLSLLSDSNQRPRDYKSRALAN